MSKLTIELSDEVAARLKAVSAVVFDLMRFDGMTDHMISRSDGFFVSLVVAEDASA